MKPCSLSSPPPIWWLVLPVFNFPFSCLITCALSPAEPQQCWSVMPAAFFKMLRMLNVCIYTRLCSFKVLIRSWLARFVLWRERSLWRINRFLLFVCLFYFYWLNTADILILAICSCNKPEVIWSLLLCLVPGSCFLHCWKSQKTTGESSGCVNDLFTVFHLEMDAYTLEDKLCIEGCSVSCCWECGVDGDLIHWYLIYGLVYQQRRESALSLSAIVHGATI